MPFSEKLWYFGLFSVLDQSCDKLRHAGERFAALKKVSKHFLSMVQAITDYFLKQFEIIVYTKKSQEFLFSLSKERYLIINNLLPSSFSREEHFVIRELRPLLDTINVFTDGFVVMHKHNYVRT